MLSRRLLGFAAAKSKSGLYSAEMGEFFHCLDVFLSLHTFFNMNDRRDFPLPCGLGITGAFSSLGLALVNPCGAS